MSPHLFVALLISTLLHGAMFCPWVVWNRVFNVGGLKNQPSYTFSVELVQQDDGEILAVETSSPDKFTVKTKIKKESATRVNETLDVTGDPVLSAYASNLRSEIDRYVKSRFPTYLRRKGITARTRVQFHLNADGSVLGLDLIQSSGYAAIDTLVLQAFKIVAPFSPIPEQLNRNKLFIELPFLFHVAQQ